MIKTHGLEFDDIYLQPDIVSKVDSRNSIDTSAKIGGYRVDVPLIASPMFDVINEVSAKIIMENGAYAILHRFFKPEIILEQWKSLPNETAVSIGITNDDIEIFDFYYRNGIRYFCIDVANGANINVKNFIEEIDKDDIYLITGNVCSAANFNSVADFSDNITGVRCGIAGGAACTTKYATGIYSPMASTIREISDGRDSDSLIISDGGIKHPSDMCKAIALGADLVMMGKEFAVCEESPAVKTDDHVVFRGSASAYIQGTYRNKIKYVEGAKLELQNTRLTITEQIARYKEGLQSCMSYYNSKNLTEFRKAFV